MLSKQVNQIKIATEDDMKDLALSSLSDLVRGMNILEKPVQSTIKTK
jgi:hypothetical protein